MRKIMLVPVLALSLAALPALASERGEEHSAMPQTGWLSVEQIKQKLTQDGYDVRDVETNDEGYEVYAIDASGKRLEASIDPRTGEVLGEVHDD
jgi:hypothetical protein